MNVVRNPQGQILSPAELAYEANLLTKRHPFTSGDFSGPGSRIQGAGHCDCGGNGDFILLPVDDPNVIEGGKRYMQCKKCGCWSHL